MNNSDANKLPLTIWMLCFLLLFTSGAKKNETIPASVYISVAYGEEKNRETYRRDILSNVENYLQNRGCFKKVTIDAEEKADLTFSLIIDKLEFSHHYGASLGTMMSNQTDPGVRLQQHTNLELEFSMEMKKSGSEKILFQRDIRIKESRQKMTLEEDAERYLWESILNSINNEIEKKICRKHKKIRKIFSLDKKSD